MQGEAPFSQNQQSLAREQASRAILLSTRSKLGSNNFRDNEPTVPRFLTPSGQQSKRGPLPRQRQRKQAGGGDLSPRGRPAFIPAFPERGHARCVGQLAPLPRHLSKRQRLLKLRGLHLRGRGVPQRPGSFHVPWVERERNAREEKGARCSSEKKISNEVLLRFGETVAWYMKRWAKLDEEDWRPRRVVVSTNHTQV